jgi:hypothetical protein
MLKHMKKIKRFQVRQGIYLDFEGFEEQKPALAGVLIDDNFQQVVLDPALKNAAEAKELRIESLDSLIDRLLAECERNSRFIIAFSIYEQDVIRRELGIDISTRYKNALRFARRWKAKYLPEVTLEKNSLDEFLQLPEVGYEVPGHLEKGQATKWLRSVLGGLEKRSEYSKLTPKQRESWDSLLEYNRHDVLGLNTLVKRASQDLKR